MKKIKLTQGKYALVDDADYEWLNQWSNLKTATGSDNQANRNISKNNTSGIPGVRWDINRQLWKVSFRRNKKSYNVGNFKDKKLAIARLQERLKYV